MRAYLFFTLLFLSSNIMLAQQTSVAITNITDTILVKNGELTGLFNCMQYEKYDEHKVDKNGLEQVEIIIGKPSVKIYFSGRAYVKEYCVDTVRYKGKPANGLFKIYNLNSGRHAGGMASADYYFGLNHIDYVVANFADGKKEGIWYYYPAEPTIIWNGDKVSKVFRPIKCEIYKNGKPDGLWWQFVDGNKMIFFEYENGKFLK